MITDEIITKLYELQDSKDRDLQAGLTPSVESSGFIGVRTPQLRALAKEYAKCENIGEFLSDLPHKYFEENQLHAFIISLEKDFDTCLGKVKSFLPYVDNWATCDQMIPKSFGKHRTELLPCIKEWLASDRTYTVRFGIKMLMEHFLGDAFDVRFPRAVAKIRSDEYYVKMMQAWYFATALAKQYDAVIPFIENRSLDDWTHNKAIQKAVESYRVTDEHKDYLRTLKAGVTKKSKGEKQ